MRTTLSAGQLAIMALSLSPLASALAWPRWLPDIDSLVVRRDDSSSSNNSSSSDSSSPETASDSSSDPTTTGKTPPKVTTTNLNNAGITKSGGDGNGTASPTATHTEFPAQDPPGNVVMVTPAATAGTTNLYKIGQMVTWGWNYTNLQGTPTAVDVLVTVPALTSTYTLTQNMTFETPAVFEWDTAKYNEEHIGDQLPTEQYTLVIYDSDGGPKMNAEAGYLAPFSGFKFGMYQPRAEVPIGEYKCATCSGALGANEKRAIGLAAGMSAVTVLSFTWFVVGLGGLM